MELNDYLAAITAETEALVLVAGSADLAAAVPSCPGWSVSDLLEHLGTTQRWAAGIVERRATGPGGYGDVVRPGDPAELPAWVRAGADHLVEVLAAAPPEAEVWTIAGPGSVAFWYRRQAHEVALHRIDAELAVGAPTPISADLARDGIDEFLVVLAIHRLRDRLTGTGETVHLHCTDGDGEWLVRLTPDGPEVERAHAKGDVALRGSASDLLLVLRGRAGIDAVEVFGDAEVFARFEERARI